ncbi:hypothetical protein BIV57_14685 [Mangrovactinospora gilvigrisea]|uniref:DUF3515 domain-containing protein n=1 Tax=Mangrovactinospora gilvigrisea TaxID=1428644 RepID=A0A1J7BDH7_9ACTN|nr:DUF3515 family protein [Mangrovactinospora gilvigrisea]OIV36702.1 hypothetical protein BIV57_14685 [Mangrovactinospora gilvigrisea]
MGANRFRFAGVAALVLVAGCGASGSDSGAVRLAAPRPGSERAAAACRALAARLPEKVDGLARRDVTPKSAYTAAWGKSGDGGHAEVEMRCGVGTPAVLTPGSATYNPTADSAAVNGVEWLFEKAGGSGAERYTTIDRAAEVQVRVAKRGSAGSSAMVDPLLDFASAVKSAVRSTS